LHHRAGSEIEGYESPGQSANITAETFGVVLESKRRCSFPTEHCSVNSFGVISWPLFFTVFHTVMLLQLPTSLVGAITQHTTVRFGLWLGTGVRKQLTIESPLRRNEHCTKGNAISTSECFTLYSVQLVAELNSKPYYGPGCATLQN